MPGKWHSEWQAEVPAERREVTLGRHRADVVTPSGWVVEIQHSYLSVLEADRRERHYGLGIWIVDMDGRQSPPPWTKAVRRWKVFLDYGDYLSPIDRRDLKLTREWMVDFINSGQNLIELNWKHAKATPAGRYSFCSLCSKVAYMVDPFDGMPKHKTCAEDALTYQYAGGAL